MAARDTKALIVKVTYNTEIRRFTANADALTWSSLAKQTANLFSLNATNANLKLTYLDDEEDRVTISSDAELAEAVQLALAASPPVLRLSVLSKPDTNDSGSDPVRVAMTDAATAADKPNTAEAGNMARPRTADATSHMPYPSTAEAGNHPQMPSSANPEEMGAFFATLARQLPSLVAQLPPNVRAILPHAELDVAATIAANAAANATSVAAATANDIAAAMSSAASGAHPVPNAAPGQDTAAGVQGGVHVGVTCDRSGVCPIVGMRYHLVGHNYDLCQSEYDKLDEKQKSLYQAMPPPSNTPYVPNIHQGVHPGVECDRSGICPIVGVRYNLRGHNYDLCQAEFNKLPSNEKLLYTPIPPPDSTASPNAAPPWRGGRGWGGGWGGGGRWGNGAGGFGCGGAAGGGAMWGGGAKLAARFVRDITVFDGTQMGPLTPFTKIWRLKNTGEVPWPPGTRMLFVGGDQMTTEMSVPLSRATAVQPGEEVDVAVEMVAPQALGRYLGYWRLVGPHGRRKFGQRVWCHVQVVDPSEAPPPLTEADLDRTRAEIENKKATLAANETDADPNDDKPPEEKTEEAMDVLPATVVPSTSDDAAERGNSDDEAIVITDAMALEAQTATSEPQTVVAVAEALAQMGFTDKALVEVVLDKHGADLNACARDLAAASEWDSLLTDLEEMGFQNRELNKTLLLKHSGNVKQTVRALVEDA